MAEQFRSEEIKEALDSAIALSFADMSFLDVQPALEEKDVVEGQLLHINFLSPASGGMLLHLPLELKQQTVENIHAKPWEDLNIAEIDDCLLELLNVLAGNFLQQLLGEETRVNLSFPEVLFELTEIDAIESYENYYYSAEGIGLSVSLYIARTDGERT